MVVQDFVMTSRMLHKLLNIGNDQIYTAFLLKSCHI
jgi:hypothetical protein